MLVVHLKPVPAPQTPLLSSQAKESFARMQPPEVRILKHLLTLEDPQRLRAELAAAFEPGPELATEQQDFLSTCAVSQHSYHGCPIVMCCRGIQ